MPCRTAHARVAGRAVNREPLLPASEHLLDAPGPLDGRLRHRHDVPGLVGQEARRDLRIVLVAVARDGALDGRPHRAVVGVELRVRLGVIALGVVHVALGHDRRVVARLAAAAEQPGRREVPGIHHVVKSPAAADDEGSDIGDSHAAVAAAGLEGEDLSDLAAAGRLSPAKMGPAAEQRHQIREDIQRGIRTSTANPQVLGHGQFHEY